MEYALLAAAILLFIVLHPSNPSVPRNARKGEDPKVHRCWNCFKPIPLAAARCPHCGVPQ